MCLYLSFVQNEIQVNTQTARSGSIPRGTGVVGHAQGGNSEISHNPQSHTLPGFGHSVLSMTLPIPHFHASLSVHVDKDTGVFHLNSEVGIWRSGMPPEVGAPTQKVEGNKRSSSNVRIQFGATLQQHK